MSGAGGAPALRTRPRLALGSMLAVQAVATLALTVPAVMAPVVAPMLGVPAHRIGWFVGLAYLTAMFTGLVAGARVSRVGAVRMARGALWASAAGLALTALGTVSAAWLPVLALAAIALGIGYGPPNPAGSMVLAVHAPPARRGLYFSIKQTGVPIGIGLAGLLVPPLLAVMSWNAALLVLAALCATLAWLLRVASVLDAVPAAAAVNDPPPTLHAMIHETAAPLARVWRELPLRRIAVASLAFGMTQLSFVTFLVSYLKLEHDMSLAVAAGVLSVSQVLSVGCRVMWGQVADRWVPPLRLLAILGLAMAGCSAALGALPADAPIALSMAAALASAATSMSWNGVYLAALAQQVPARELGAVTGGTQFVTFCGAMGGPVLFASLVGLTGSHGATYIVMAAAPAAVGVWLWIASRET
jgi:MFS family permease